MQVTCTIWKGQTMLINDVEYKEALQEVVDSILTAQYSAAVSSNLALLYRNIRIGKVIIDKSNWGNKFIDNLASDIKRRFPGTTGYSVRNLKYMKKFANLFTEDIIEQMGFAGLTWYHHMALMDKTKDEDHYLWYLSKAIENGWTRDILVMQIESELYERESAPKIQNFTGRLPDKQSELALQTMKDPYIFDFVHMRDRMIETDIEHEMVNNVSKLLLELGRGFAYVGEQYQLKVQEEEFFIDLLFYNYLMHCFFAVDLKTGKFVPEYAGKMNFYLSVLDDQVKGENDNPSIGLILCRDKNRIVAEYSLKDMTKPIGVSEYKLFEDVPKELQDTVPSIEDIESRILDKYKCE